MNKKILFSILAGMMTAVGFSSCDDADTEENQPDGGLSTKETALKSAIVAYVDNTVLPTYLGMADAAVELYDLCAEIQSKHASNTLTEDDIREAGDVWKTSRKYWELSEAFLYGPAANHNIDPHIDSWPLNKVAMDALLADIRSGKNWDLTNNGGYGLLGFHSLEYMLFELSADGNTPLPHSTSYTSEELVYMVAVAADLRDQCVCLEACWTGMDGVSSRKQNILSDAELDYGENYGWIMKNAGSAGSLYLTYQEAAEELIQGCIDIADEVGNQKIGRPHMAASEEDRDYIESPYSLNSIEDFADNIRSIQNSYCGSNDGDASVSDYIRSVNADLDARVLAKINEAIQVIERIPEPFASTATGSEAAKAVEVVGSELVEVLQEAYQALGRS